MNTDDLEHVGSIPVDSGTLILVDPCHLENWRKTPSDELVRTPVYRDKDTGKTYAYGGFGIKAHEVDNVFSRYNVQLSDYCGQTPNELRDSGQWVLSHEAGVDHSGEFSFAGVCQTLVKDIRATELANLAVAVSPGYGDGMYPVFAEYTADGYLEGIYVRFIDDED
ncbi:MAG: hypothetical protein D4S01_07355 [Dehalococcoidia bacterium]|nr:MAG: hypothetical protein D4S01_07355 [Dehalococcoidia bacterium]